MLLPALWKCEWRCKIISSSSLSEMVDSGPVKEVVMPKLADDTDSAAGMSWDKV